MTSSKLNGDEMNLSKVCQKIFLTNLNEFIITKENVREKLLHQNNLLKIKFRKIQIEERDLININKPLIFDTDLFSINVINEDFNYDNIYINNTESIPKGVFCYPIRKNYRPEDNLTKFYMMNFKNYGTYDFVIGRTYKSLSNKFVILPNTINDETILNKEFIIWACCLIIKKFNKEKINFEKICNIIKRISDFLNKKFESIYKIVSNYLSKFSLHKKKINSDNKFICIKKYREYYCQICYEYCCKLHFYTNKEIITFESLKDVKGKPIKFSRKKFKKLCSTIQFTISNKGRLNIIQSYNCPDSAAYLNCGKFCDLLCDENKNDDNYYKLSNYLSQNFSINEIFILSLLYTSEIMINPCSIKKFILFGNSKITCNLLMQIFNIFIQDKLTFFDAVDNFINSKNIGLYDFKLKKELILHRENSKTISFNRIKFQHSKTIYDYVPCVHEGICNKSVCSCIKFRGYCEKFCSCRSYCDNLFKGCECIDGCKMTDDENNSNCRCVSNGRECDPDLCHKQSQNIFNYALNICSYNNMNISYERHKKICLAKSVIIDHYGIFALENIEPDELICEYTGEVISKKETERRYVFFDWIDMNYIFGLSKESDIDAFNFVSKMRYVNHSSHGYENAYARIKFVWGNYRIGLYALRYINSGEEIFFDYRIQYGQPYWLNRYNNQYGKN